MILTENISELEKTGFGQSGNYSDPFLAIFITKWIPFIFSRVCNRI